MESTSTVNDRTMKQDSTASSNLSFGYAYPAIVSFPELPTSLSPMNNKPPSHLLTKMKRHKNSSSSRKVKKSSSLPIERKPSAMMARSTPSSRTAPIALPESHIQRTPSEIHLEHMTRQADYEDVRMYSRLLCGMQNQLRRQEERCVISSSEDDDAIMHPNSTFEVHPLSRKSLQGLVKTRLASYNQDLEHQEREIVHDDSTHDDDDIGWDVSYIPIDEEIQNCPLHSSAEFPPSSHGKVTDHASKFNIHMRKDEHESDCVFSMDL